MTELSYNDNPKTEMYILNQLNSNSNLSGWERSFIKNVKEYSDGGGFLSDRQKQVLSDLWEKY